MAMLITVCASVAGAATGDDGTGDKHRQRPGASYAVAAQRQPLTTNANSPVAHDTETEALVAHSGRLFAATGQWEYPGPSAFGQVLVKKSKTQSVDGLRADTVPSGPGAGLLPDPERPGSRAGAFPPRHPSDRRRALEDPVVARRRQLLLPRILTFSPPAPTSARSGRTSRAGSGRSMPGSARPGSSGECGRQLATHWCSIPNPSSPWPHQGRPVRSTQKVTGFADCAGALYTTINTTLYRRNDGTLPSGVPRWVPVYQAPPVGTAQQWASGHHLPHP